LIISKKKKQNLNVVHSYFHFKKNSALTVTVMRYFVYI